MTDERIAICGGPRAGKTTFVAKHWPDARHTDDVMHLGWSEASAEVSTWFDEPGPWCVEGVAVVRALRKWLARSPEGKPCDRLIMCVYIGSDVSKGQDAMRKGVDSVMREIGGELQRRGVVVQLNAPRDEAAGG